MKLYYAKGACSLVVRIIINEIGLKSAYESVDLKTKQTQTGNDFLKINPKGAVPTLETDEGEILTENAVILQFLADKSHVTQLLPPIPEFKRYRVLEWLNFITTELHKGFGPLFKPNFPQEVKDKFVIPLLESKFTYVDKHLQHNQYLLGDHFTLPDAYLFVMLGWWTSKFKFDLNRRPHLLKFYDALKNRESIKKSLQEEG